MKRIKLLKTVSEHHRILRWCLENIPNGEWRTVSVDVFGMDGKESFGWVDHFEKHSSPNPIVSSMEVLGTYELAEEHAAMFKLRWA
jgi:hypothetical protein